MLQIYLWACAWIVTIPAAVVAIFWALVVIRCACDKIDTIIMRSKNIYWGALACFHKRGMTEDARYALRKAIAVGDYQYDQWESIVDAAKCYKHYLESGGEADALRYRQMLFERLDSLTDKEPTP